MRRLAFLAPLLLTACATSPTPTTPSYRAATESCRAITAAQMAKDDPQSHAAGNEGTTAHYAAIYEKCMRDAGWGSALTPPSPPPSPLPPPTPPIMPPSAAAATDGSAEITITSEPPLAEIWVDGRFVGSAPVKLPLTAGTHAIEARRSGFANWKRDLSVTGGVPARVVALLER